MFRYVELLSPYFKIRCSYQSILRYFFVSLQIVIILALKELLNLIAHFISDNISLGPLVQVIRDIFFLLALTYFHILHAQKDFLALDLIQQSDTFALWFNYWYRALVLLSWSKPASEGKCTECTLCGSSSWSRRILFQLLPVAGSQFLAAPSSHLPASSQIIIHLPTDSNHLLENTNTSATNDALRRWRRGEGNNLKTFTMAQCLADFKSNQENYIFCYTVIRASFIGWPLVSR